MAMGNDFQALTCSAWSNLGASYPITDDRSTTFWSEFGSGAVPRNVIIDAQGMVHYNSTGFNETAITNSLNQLLATSDTKPEPRVPEEPLLISNYPNPFNGGTRISIDLTHSADLSLMIFDSRGEWMQTLSNTYLEAGRHSFIWQGIDARGNSLPAGVYLARMESNGRIVSRKLLLLK